MGSWLDMAATAAFIGRARELRALDRWRAERARLVTLTGGAGMGKTRLALEWARARDADAAAVFCDLSESRSVDQVCAIVARALGSPLTAAGSPDDAVAQIGRALAESGRSVVVLDNFEQLVAHAPRLILPWLSLAPAATFVVTSRERLRLDGEVCVEVEPLSLPPAAARAAGDIASSEAVELFVSRARAARSDVVLADADAEAIASIVRRLEGIPLAIELCAARAGVLAPRQILERLSRRFELLSAGVRGAPARQATLRGAIDWSWDLLEPHAKAALAQCSVFRGGFSLEAAERVIDPADGAPPVLDVLQALHEKSLLRTYDAPGVPGERRYGLLESLREYAEERLGELGGGGEASARHEAFFLAVSGDPGAAVPVTGDVRRLSLEADNLVAVCTRALARRPLSARDADVALRALVLLDPVLLASAEGRLEPYAAMLDAALSVEAPPSVVRARAQYTRAIADLLRGRVLDCLARFRRALDEARACGARADASRALTKVGLLLDLADQADEARACFDEARAILRDLGEAALDGDYLIAKAGAELWRGRALEALAYAERAVEHVRAAGDRRLEAVALAQLAQATVSLGRLDQAQGFAAEALAVLAETQDRRTEGYVLGIQGRVAQARGLFAEARERLAAALSIHRAVGDRMSEGVVEGYCGGLAFEEGALEEALAGFARAGAALRDSGERHYTAMTAAAAAAVEAALGRGPAAARHLDAAARALASVRTPSTHAAAAIYRALAEIALAGGDASREPPARAQAAAAVALARSPDPDGGLGPAASSEDVRVALRLLEREVSRPARGSAAPAEASRAAALPVLVVGPEARWFRVGEGAPVRLHKSRSARLLLARLARQRIESPGKGLPLDALFAVGWPGERIARSAAKNRVYVTITKLRQLGLAGLLRSRDDGFLLAPEGVVLEAVPEEPPEPSG